jgi:hypothetical protein
MHSVFIPVRNKCYGKGIVLQLGSERDYIDIFLMFTPLVMHSADGTVTALQPGVSKAGNPVSYTYSTKSAQRGNTEIKPTLLRICVGRN